MMKMTYYDEILMNEISNIRYGELGRILFDFSGKTIAIQEPIDVLLVGLDKKASRWIVKKYGYLLKALL